MKIIFIIIVVKDYYILLNTESDVICNLDYLLVFTYYFINYEL